MGKMNQSIIPSGHPLQGATNSITWPLAMGCGKEGPRRRHPKIVQMVAEVDEIKAVLVLTAATISNVRNGVEGLEGLELGNEVADEGVNHR